MTSLVLPIIGLCELGNCPQTTGCGVLRGSARPKSAANINLGSFYGVGMPVAVVLAFCLRFDFQGLWFGMLAAQASCVVLMMAVISRTDWTAEAGRAQQLTGASLDAIPVKLVPSEAADDAEDDDSSLGVSVVVEQPGI